VSHVIFGSPKPFVRTANGKPLHLFFTNVAVKLKGSNAWIVAK